MLAACSSDDPKNPLTPPAPSTASGLFIINQGNFMAGNSSLTYYDPATAVAEHNVFFRANEVPLGDAAQSMTIDSDNVGWVVVNNSNIIFAIDADTYREKGRITDGIFSPRFIHFVSADKAYITQMYSNRIAIADPRTYAVTGYVTVPETDSSDGSTEMMVQYGKYVYANCWSYDNRILKIDTETDRVVDVLHTVGIQPKSMTIDARGNLWVITDGGYYGSPYGYENPTLEKIDLDSFAVVRTFEMKQGANVGSVITDGSGTRLYYVCDDVYSMAVDAETLPAEPVVSADGNYLMAMTVDPERGDIYVADAIDYQQPGVVRRYSSDGSFVADIPAGIIPGGFCWKK